MAKRFELFHWVENGGDGSAIVHNAVTRDSAEKKDEAQPERWGESSVSSTILEVDGDKLYLVGSNWDGKKMVEYRHELKRASK